MTMLRVSEWGWYKITRGPLLEQEPRLAWMLPCKTEYFIGMSIFARTLFAKVDEQNQHRGEVRSPKSIFMYQSIHLSFIYVSIYLSVCHIYFFSIDHLSFYLSIFLSYYHIMYLSIYLPSYLSFYPRFSEAFLQSSFAIFSLTNSLKKLTKFAMFVRLQSGKW